MWFFRSQTANGQTATAGSPTLPAPGGQISGLLPASDSRTTLTRIPPYRLFLIVSSLLPLSCCLFLVTSSLSSHLACFLAHFVGRPHFRFAASWIVGLAIDGVESRDACVDSFHFILLAIARLKLWLILMTCLCYLVSALTNTNDILKVALCQIFVIEPVTLANLMIFLKVGLRRFLIWDLGQFFAKTSTIEPVTLANLMVYLCHRASYSG